MPKVQSALTEFLPVAGSILSNPIDANNLTSPDIIYRTLSVLGKLPEIHTLIYHMGFHPLSRWGDGRLSSESYLQSIIDVLIRVKETTCKPVILAIMPALDIDGMKDFVAVQEALVKAQFPVFHSLRQAAKAIASLIAWRRA